MLPLLVLTAATALSGGAIKGREQLQKDLASLSAKSDGRLGACVLDQDGAEPLCVRGTEAFPLQSVMKLIVSAAVLEQVDAGKYKLSDMINIKPEQISPGPEEFAALIRAKGQYRATIEELIRRSIVDSDSTSIDVLLEHSGGIAMVQDFLRKHKMEGLRVDRNERQLQAEFSGLSWQPAYSKPGAFEGARNAVAPAKQLEAFEAYLKDPRDTGTPAAMVKFLKALASGKILSPTSTTKLLAIMDATVTGKDRLRAGVPRGWTFGNKTGTSYTVQGRAGTINDVGLLKSPEGATLAVAVFIADSRQSNSERAALMAEAAAAAARATTQGGGT